MNQTKRNIEDKFAATCFGIAIFSGLGAAYCYTLGAKAARLYSSPDDPADLPAEDLGEDKADPSPESDGDE